MFFLSKMIAIINPFCCCCWFWLFTNTHTFTSYDNRIELNWIQFNLILWWAIILTTLASIDNIDQIPYRMIRILCVCVCMFSYLSNKERTNYCPNFIAYIQLNWIACLFVWSGWRGKKQPKRLCYYHGMKLGFTTHTHTTEFHLQNNKFLICIS